MTVAVIGGVERALGAWKPTKLKLRANKPTIDVASFPMQFDVGPFPQDFDQLELSSCGPNSYAEQALFYTGEQLSRLWLYFFTRATEGDFIDDDGVTIPDMLTVAHTMGLPLESTWKYDVANYAVPPPVDAFPEAVTRRLQGWDPIADLEHLMFEISNKSPIMLGVQLPASVQDGASDFTKTGVVPVPTSANPSIGGHCINAIAVDRDRRMVKCPHHWGKDVGDDGCMWLPYEHFTTGNACDLAALRGLKRAA